jgi:hypothetical protein
MAITRITNIASTIPDGSIANEKLSDIVNFKNIIINGDMQLAQRSTSVASITTTGYYTVDRFQADVANIGTWTQSQSTDTPTGQGFATSLKMDCTTADTSLGTGDLLRITQRIEGQNIQYLKKGTANAVSLTLSFWVKSNKTGTYIAELFDDNSRSISKSYTVNTTNTWEKKTITYEGDTTGTIDNDNTIGLSLHLWLAAGSTYTSGTLNTTWNSVTSANRAVGQVNLADSTANEWYITGVQLEAGTTASDFEFLPVDVNLQRCQRYFIQYGTGIGGADAANIGVGQWYSASEIVYNVYAPVSMRTKPTMTTPTVVNQYRFHKAGTYIDTDNAGVISDAGNQIMAIYKSGLSGGTGGQATFVVTQAAGAKIQFSAEL